MSETVETVAPEAPAAPDTSPAADLRSALAAAYDEAERTATETPEADSGPQRDERGRFVGAAQEEEAPADDEPQAEAAPEAAPAQVAEPAAPDPVRTVLDEYKPLYAARGIAPDQAMRSLFEAQKILEERPAEAIAVLARQYGVDLRQFAPQPQTPAQPAARQTNDPAMAAVLQEVAQLKQFITTQQQQAQAAEAQKVEQTIAQFAADPKHPHFPAVRHMMGALMQAGTAKDMNDAYEMACRAHPEVWKQIQAAEEAQKAKAEAEKRAQAAAAARAKAPTLRGNAPAPGAVTPPKNLRGLLEAAWDGRLN